MCRIGIIAAMDEEIDNLKSKMEVEQQVSRAGMDFVIGKLEDVDIVAVRCGIGKVNAAACTQLLCDRFDVDKIINTGIAGSLDRSLHIGDVVIAEDLVQYDMDVHAFGYKLGQIPRIDTYAFETDKELVELTKKACSELKLNHKWVTGRIISGDKFVNSAKEVERLRELFEGRAVEMESAAIAHVAYINKVPITIIRSISDDADDSANISYDEFARLAADNACNIVINILRYLNK